MNLLQWGAFTGHSGDELQYKIECEALGNQDWDCAAQLMLALAPGTFHTVIGIPRGGVALGDRLREHATPGGLYYLVVDDVFTTGGSLIEAARPFADKPVAGLVLFARKKTPGWIRPVFTVNSLLARL